MYGKIFNNLWEKFEKLRGKLRKIDGENFRKLRGTF